MDYLKPLRLLGGLFYPRVCAICQQWLVQGEVGVCMHCLDKLPRTGFLFQQGNPVEKVFWGRIPLAFASSYLHFRKNGLTQNLLHQIKYKGNQDLAEHLGSLFGADLKAANPEFKPEVLVPVPLHPRKEKQRGYNQASLIASGLGKVLEVPVVNDLLVRNNYSGSQTRMGRYRRWQNVETLFSVNQKVANKYSKIILIDDVVTTGATAEACLNPIIQSGLTEPGYLSLAFASG